jgi:hypothetical protein
MTFKFIMTATRRFMQTTSQCPVVGKRDVIGFFPVACHSRGFPTGSKRDWKAHSYCSVSRKFVSLARLQLYGDEVAGKVLAGELIGLADLVLQASGSQLHRIAAVPVAPREGVNVRRSEE